MASENRDSLEIATTAHHSPDAAGEMCRNLTEMTPDPVKLTVRALVDVNSKRDEGGTDVLRELM